MWGGASHKMGPGGWNSKVKTTNEHAQLYLTTLFRDPAHFNVKTRPISKSPSSQSSLFKHTRKRHGKWSLGKGLRIFVRTHVEKCSVYVPVWNPLKGRILVGLFLWDPSPLKDSPSGR